MNLVAQGRDMAMMHRQTTLPRLKFFCLVSVLWMLTGCETSGGGGEACAGFEDIISCVQIVNIVPQDSTGENNSDVDAFQSLCDPGPPAVFELFTAHNAAITFSNDLLPTADDGFDIRLTSFSITYTVVDCPAGAFCPRLSSLDANRTVLIPAGNDVTQIFPFVPLSVKAEYRNAVGDAGRQFVPTYVARYVFSGETVPFTAGVTIRGEAEFQITDFNVCL